MSFVIRTSTNLPFGQIVGMPLKAAIEAQAIGAKATVDFIQSVGFKTDGNGEDDLLTPTDQSGNEMDGRFGNVRNITFKYQKITTDPLSPENIEQIHEIFITLPILTIIPIPFIRIDEIDVDFTAKISEMFKSKTGGRVGFDWGGSNVRMNASYSNRYNSEQENSSESTMKIRLRAVQEGIPPGMSKMLNILEQAIGKERTITAPAQTIQSIPVVKTTPPLLHKTVLPQEQPEKIITKGPSKVLTDESPGNQTALNKTLQLDASDQEVTAPIEKTEVEQKNEGIKKNTNKTIKKNVRKRKTRKKRE